MAAFDRPTELDARVIDYLDDKFQTWEDLGTLESLLSNIQTQHGLLQKQLEEAERDLEESKQAAREHDAQLQRRAERFEEEWVDINRRKMILTQSDSIDEAHEKLKPLMEKLRNLDVAQGYIDILTEVDRLSNEAQTQLGKDDEAALQSYRELRTFLNTLKPLHEAAEEGAPHLMDHVTNAADTVRKRIKDAFAGRLEAVLKNVNWPRADTTLLGQNRDDFVRCVDKLLDLQVPELEAHEAGRANRRSQPAPLVLLPFEVLVHPLEMRFRYHFEGDKPTNRLDKPEYFLAHVTDLLSSYNPFVVDYLQPLLSRRFKGTDLAFNTMYIDATSALITALLPMVRRKIFAILPKVSEQPQLLSHQMHEILSFDTTIREEWGYDGGNGLQGWKGLAWEVLVEKDAFGRWLQVEKDFALARYQSIIENPESGELDYDSVEASATKPTKAAIRVNDLLETITDRYKPLSSFSQKLRFLIDIQISIFDRFHERLHGSLEAYLTMTSTIGRTVQNISREELANLQGVGGLDRLCRVFGSADYLERAMRDWSDDIFFLELWEELQDRARSNNRKSLAGPMSISDVAERTSSAVGSEDDDGGALFDETAASYNRLRIRSEGIIVDVLSNNIREAIRPYRHINPWTTASSVPGTSHGLPTPTAELDPTITYLDTSLAFLSRALAAAPLRRITRQCLATLQSLLWDQVLTRHHFSTAGATQLATDLSAICRVVNRWVGDGVAETGLRKILEGVQLIGLPVQGTRDGEAGGDDVEQSVDDVAGLGLWEVERKLFADNESARQVLEEMGMETLTEAEARSVLERRVELSS